MSGAELEGLRARIGALLPDQDLTDHEPLDPAALGLPAPRITPPDSLASVCSTELVDRAAHTHGKDFGDVVRNLHGRLEHPVDLCGPAAH